MAYATLSTMQLIFGARNVAIWSDPDRDQNTTTIAARQAIAITIADEEVDTTLRNGPYTIPVVTLAGATPTLINVIASIMAGVWLYEVQGTIEIDSEKGKVIHRYSSKLEWARQALADVRDGKRVISGMK